MKKKKKIRFAIALGILCIILLGVSSTLTVFCFRIQQKQEKSAKKVEVLQKKRDILKQELENLQSEVRTLSEQSDALKADIEDTEETKGITDGGELSLDKLESDVDVSGIDDLKPGAIIPANQVSPFGLDSYFKTYEILEGDEIYSRIIGKSYRENDSVSLSDLRYVKLLHYNYNGEIQVGELIVNVNLADDYLSAFQKLFESKYQIQSMYLIDNYWTGDADSTDTASIEENNTSCFNYRLSTGGQSLSNHAYGCAIDINPQQNPYVWFDSDGSLTCYHDNATAYLDRTTGAEHMITHEDLCYQVFSSLGFNWGGDWSDPIDYQHFEKVI